MENWKPIKGYEGLYEISDTGKVKSLAKGIVLSLNRLTKCGYRKASLSKDGKAKENRIHRLVALHFIPNTDDKETVNHKDGNKLNNHVDNLEWSTRTEQVVHSYQLGLKKGHKGSTNAQSKLTDEQVREIKSLYAVQGVGGLSSTKLAKIYGVTHRVILLIVNNESYKNV